MKFFIFILLITSSIFAEEKSKEVIIIEDLIQITQKKLDEEKKILPLLQEYQEKKDAFLKDMDSPKCATELVLISMKIKKDLENSPLNALFSSQFLEEIAFFSKVGNAASQ